LGHRLLYNPLHRLQMRLMCWDVDIVHRNDIHLTDADYWSRLGADICYDPLFKSYLDFDRGLCEMFPAPVELPMLPENMPYYRGPPSSRNSRNARRSSKMAKTYSITFAPLATVLRFMAISFILFNPETVTQPLISGNSRQQLSLSFELFDPSR
jgi:hypothetical protein